MDRHVKKAHSQKPPSSPPPPSLLPHLLPPPSPLSLPNHPTPPHTHTHTTPHTTQHTTTTPRALTVKPPLSLRCGSFCVGLQRTATADMAAREGASSARRRRNRQFREWHRHNQRAVAMELATALHHSASVGRPTHASVGCLCAAAAGRSYVRGCWCSSPELNVGGGADRLCDGALPHGCSVGGQKEGGREGEGEDAGAVVAIAGGACGAPLAPATVRHHGPPPGGGLVLFVQEEEEKEEEKTSLDVFFLSSRSDSAIWTFHEALLPACTVSWFVCGNRLKRQLCLFREFVLVFYGKVGLGS